MFVTVECYRCGILFGLPTQYHAKRHDDHESFYCPNGHSQAYFGKTEEQKQRERADRLERSLDSVRSDRDRTERRRRAQVAATTRARRHK